MAAFLGNSHPPGKLSGPTSKKKNFVRSIAVCLHIALTTSSSIAQINNTNVSSAAHNIKTVFVIVMENHNWTGDGARSIKANPSAPYINHTLLPQASYASNYNNPPHIHPSLPNYLWMEAGTNFGILDDNTPLVHHQNTRKHLTAYLESAGISWRDYDEGSSGILCPLKRWHDPFVFFDDVTGNNNPHSTKCIAHSRPLGQLARDLKANTVARYSFIAPGGCHSMHDACNGQDRIKQGDDWLASFVPAILNSDAYRQNGMLIIVWDEGRGLGKAKDGPIPMILLSPLAKGNGYTNNIRYTHGSLLRTLQEIFVPNAPLIRDANYEHDLSDLFLTFP